MGGSSSTISTSETRIEALTLQSSAYGVTIPLVYGVNRIGGNMLWYGDFKANAHTSSQTSGGKGGGGGGVTQVSTTYTYSASVMMGLCEGPISAIPRIWKGKKLFVGSPSAASQLSMSIAAGLNGQATWPYLSSSFPAQAIGYSGLAHVYAQDYELGASASIENHSFEIAGQLAYSGGYGAPDANTALIAVDVLTNPRYGASFPAGQIDTAAWSTYCLASNILLSPALTEQMQAGEFVAKICALTNTGAVWSGNQLKMIPYGDTVISGNGATYTPNITPLYDLTDDDFTPSVGSDPIRVKRKPQADAYNHIRVEFVNRANYYNVEITEAKDSANIDAYGLRSAEIVSAHWICDADIARTVAQLLLQRAMYIRNTYEFDLPWTRALLEPMDLVTLTDAGLGYNKLAVRITEIGESDSGDLTVVAEDFPVGVAHAALYPSQAATGFQHDYNAAPGDVLPPFIFEAPIARTTTGLEVYAAVLGKGASWGGCRLWASLDGVQYKDSGVLYGGARYGALAGPIAAGSLPITINGGQMLSGSATDSANLSTLCYIGGANPEYLAYGPATLTGSLAYTLSGLTRSAFGTSGAAHAVGDPFARVDNAIAKSGPLDLSMIGKTIYFKFTSISIYGTAEQSLATVSAFPYVVTGAALLEPLANVQNLISVFRSGLTLASWDAVPDLVRTVEYEVRKGATWAGAQVLGRTPNTEFQTIGDDTYWVSAHSGLAYSAAPASIVLAGGTLTSNVIVNYDEFALGWPGTTSGGAAIQAGKIILASAGNILSVANILAVPDIIWYGGVALSGGYDLPAGHAVNIGRVAPCSVMIGYTVRGQSIYDNMLTMSDVLSVADFLGDALGVKVSVQPQIALAQADGIYGAWNNFIPGTYNAQYYKARVLIYSSDPQVTAILSGLTFMVDAPDRMAEGNLQVAAGGMTVLYTPAFNGGTGANVAPLPQITILNAVAGDDVILSAQTLNGFTVRVVNAGVGVTRNINYKSQGY